MNQVTENTKIGWGRRIALALLDGAEETLTESRRKEEQIDQQGHWYDHSGRLREGPRDLSTDVDSSAPLC